MGHVSWQGGVFGACNIAMVIYWGGCFDIAFSRFFYWGIGGVGVDGLCFELVRWRQFVMCLFCVSVWASWCDGVGVLGVLGVSTGTCGTWCAATLCCGTVGLGWRCVPHVQRPVSVLV